MFGIACSLHHSSFEPVTMSQSILTDVFMTPEEYEDAALEFQRSLTIEDIMEAHILTLLRASFLGLMMLKRSYPELQLFNEVLVLYPFDGKLQRVVPDNMLVLNADPDREWNRTSYNLEYERDKPFLVVEYVSPSTGEKDRDDGESYHKYETHLCVPYYLIYDPESGKPLTLLRHDGHGYGAASVNQAGRFEIPELDLQIGVVDDLVRYWHDGSLLPIPTEVPDVLAEKDEALAASREALAASREALAEKDETLTEKDEALAASREQISERDTFMDQLRKGMTAAIAANRPDLVSQLAAAEDLASLQEIMKAIEG